MSRGGTAMIVRFLSSGFDVLNLHTPFSSLPRTINLYSSRSTGFKSTDSVGLVVERRLSR